MDLNGDGLSVAGDPRLLLNRPLEAENENFLCSLRDDKPELVVLSGWQLNVTLVDATSSQPPDPAHRLSLSHFKNGFLSNGYVLMKRGEKLN